MNDILAVPNAAAESSKVCESYLVGIRYHVREEGTEWIPWSIPRWGRHPMRSGQGSLLEDAKYEMN